MGMVVISASRRRGLSTRGGVVLFLLSFRAVATRGVDLHGIIRVGKSAVRTEVRVVGLTRGQALACHIVILRVSNHHTLSAMSGCPLFLDTGENHLLWRLLVHGLTRLNKVLNALTGLVGVTQSGCLFYNINELVCHKRVHLKLASDKGCKDRFKHFLAVGKECCKVLGKTKVHLTVGVISGFEFACELEKGGVMTFTTLVSQCANTTAVRFDVSAHTRILRNEAFSLREFFMKDPFEFLNSFVLEHMHC
mmetsp:Transcript_14642/g.28358  ORF Transcript_14642/g.28358 Transcript_14642/m.28358 type:complete len:250 (-) Transcript_14642:675-1424(-)